MDREKDRKKHFKYDDKFKQEKRYVWHYFSWIFVVLSLSTYFCLKVSFFCDSTGSGIGWGTQIGEKIIAPRLFSYLRQKTLDVQKGIGTLSEQVERNMGNNKYEEMEHQLNELNSRLAVILCTMNERPPRTNDRHD
jgi:hypothetical protein